MGVKIHKVLESLRSNSPYRDILTVPRVLRIDALPSLVGAMLKHWKEGASINITRRIASGNLDKCRQKVDIAKQGITRCSRTEVFRIAHNQGALDTRVV